MRADCKEALVYLGAALQHESPDDALPQFKAALRLDSKYKAALLGMAVCLEARGNLPSCINYYQQAIGTYTPARTRAVVPIRVCGITHAAHVVCTRRRC